MENQTCTDTLAYGEGAGNNKMLYYERNISRMEPPFLMRKDKLYVLLCSISTKASPVMVNAQARIQFSNALSFNRHLGLMINSTGTLGQSNGL